MSEFNDKVLNIIQSRKLSNFKAEFQRKCSELEDILQSLYILNPKEYGQDEPDGKGIYAIGSYIFNQGGWPEGFEILLGIRKRFLKLLPEHTENLTKIWMVAVDIKQWKERI